METHEITDHNETEEGSSDTVTDVIGKKWRDCTPAERRAGIEYPKADFRASGPQPHLALQDGDLEQRGGIAVLKEHEVAVHNVPDRWLFDERELASALKEKHPLVYPDYVAALDDWVDEGPPHAREIYLRVLTDLDRDRGYYSSPFYHFTSSDMILDLDGRTIRQSHLRFWIPAHSCYFMNPVGCAFVRALRPDLDPIVVESETHSLVVTAEGFVDLNIQALGQPSSEAKAELCRAQQ